MARALIPRQDPKNGLKVTLRGFPLGTWTGMKKLPAGCDYVDTGNEASGAPSQAIVECSLTADDVLNFSGDLKEQCRKKYGENVVVHIPIDPNVVKQVSCEPPQGEVCGQTPWVIGSETKSAQ
jgi:hypothetical protein